LNLFAVNSDVSRTPPGSQPNGDNDDPGFNILAKREKEDAPSPQFGGDPTLLQVSCGYFKNIVLKVLFKQKNALMKYLLIETNGVIFDKLA
jgi:hypothetical protein